MTSYAERITRKLTEGLAPATLRVKDVSHRHAGHAGADPAGETHFDVTVVSAAFRGQGRVARHRMVNDLLRDELVERVHALQLKTLTPEEAGPSAAG